MRYAVIGIGSNSCRLLIASRRANQWKIEHHDIRGTRLGQDVASSRKLAPAAIGRTLEAVSEFAALGRRADALFVIGTCALRDASNAADFARRTRELAGTDLHILTAEEEARASFAGASWALRNDAALESVRTSTICVADIGGGSTELAIGKLEKIPIEVASLPLGAVSLTERFFKHDPPTAEELSGCRTAVRLTFEALDSRVRPRGAIVLVGGTADTSARMLNAYDSESDVPVARVQMEDVSDLLRFTSSLPAVRRKVLRGLPESRADIFPAGLIIVEELARQAGAREVLIAGSDLLLGYLLEHAVM